MTTSFLKLWAVIAIATGFAAMINGQTVDLLAVAVVSLGLLLFGRFLFVMWRYIWRNRHWLGPDPLGTNRKG